MRKYLIVMLLLSTLLATSCKETSGPAVPVSMGNTYELVVVCTDKVWDGPVGDTIRSFFGQSDSTMLMIEPLYKLLHINRATLDQNRMFNFSKSILIVEVNPGSEAKGGTQRDLWAKPQRVFTLTGPTTESVVDLFGKYKDQMLKSYYEIEKEKLNVYYMSALNRDVIKKVGEKFGYTFNITTGFRIAKNYDDFMWLRSETDKTSTDFLIYNEDYISENQLSPGYIVLKRNLMTQQYVPASIEGSYAKVSDEFPVSSKEVSLNGLYAIESRGAWDCEGDYMGGTFLNYTIVDTVNNKILTIDSFVYAPSKEKRVFMMQLEAMISSIRRWVSDEAKL